MGKLIVSEVETDKLSIDLLKIKKIQSNNPTNKIDVINNTYINQGTLTEPVKPYYYINNINKQHDSTTRTYTNGNFADGMTWQAITECKPGSSFDVDIAIPMRNDSTSWGGGYTEVLYKIPESTVYTDWISMGNSGYDGVMVNGNGAILTYNRRFLLTPTVAPVYTDYSIQFKFRHRSYDNTLTINGSHDINRTGSAGDTYQNSSLEALTHFWTTIIVIEYAKHSGF